MTESKEARPSGSEQRGLGSDVAQAAVSSGVGAAVGAVVTIALGKLGGGSEASGGSGGEAGTPAVPEVVLPPGVKIED